LFRIAAGDSTGVFLMAGVEDLYTLVKQGKGPFRLLRKAAITILNPRAPRLPSVFKPPLRILYELRWLTVIVTRMFVGILIRHPLFQARCKSVGRRLTLEGPMPFVNGPVEITLGSDVFIGGKVAVLSGGPVTRPELIVKDRAAIGWNTVLTVGKEIVIEEDVIISYDCRISDTDGHPREADLRAGRVPPRVEDIHPVRICRYAWIGNGTHIKKGVTIGEGAVIGSNSVVITDIPPYSMAAGNPAEVYFKNYGRPANRRPKLAPDRAVDQAAV
jgi:acetyltransferase-like isoleucine patch superfamily enzyme